MRGIHLFFWSVLFEILIIIHTILVLWYFKLYGEGVIFGILGGCVLTVRYLSHIRQNGCGCAKRRRRLVNREIADNTSCC